MNEVDWIKSLDRASPDEPRIDVTVSVMHAVGSIQSEDEPVFPFAAAVALAVGVAAIALALPAWFAEQDPLVGFADAFHLVLR